MELKYFGILAVLICCVVFVLLIKAKTKKKLHYTQALGVLWLRSLRNFLSKIQKHRGLSNAYINGDRTKLAEIERLEATIAEDIFQISNVDRWITSNDRWSGLVEHWSRLKSHFRKSEDAQNNMLQHNRLIQNTLYLIEEMADEHSLLSLTGDASNLEYLWRDLLHAIEYMGQARAVGSGITAKKNCSSVERIRMNYLYKKIEENCLGITSKLPQGDMAEREIRSLLSTIDAHILGSRYSVR